MLSLGLAWYHPDWKGLANVWYCNQLICELPEVLSVPTILAAVLVLRRLRGE